MSDSPVIAFLNKAVDLILLNFLWLVCCLPVFTIGAATSAMYYVCIISIRQGDGYVAKRFFRAFKENFLKATIVWIGIMLVAALGFVDILFWNGVDSVYGRVMLCVSAGLLIIILMIVEYIYPVMSKFEGSVKTTIKNASAMAIGHLPYTLIVLVIDGAVLFANLKTVTVNVIMAFVGFAVVAYVKSFLFYRVFMNYMDERFDDFERERLLDERNCSGEDQ